MKPNYSRKFGITLVTLLTLYTNIAQANSVRCVNANKWTPAPLTHPIMINWELDARGSETYKIKLDLTQVGGLKGIVKYEDILSPGPNMVSKKVIIITNEKPVEMNKITFRGKPNKDSKIVIFESLDHTSYHLGYFKYRSPKARSDDWRIMSHYIIDPEQSGPPFIDSYYFNGGTDYTEDPSIAQSLECDDSSD